MFNLTTYPNLVGLLEALEVDTEPSDMSFALSIDGGALEWGSHGLDSIFAQRRNLLSPSFWLMIWDVLKFGRQAPQVGPQLWTMLVASACIACCCRMQLHCRSSAAVGQVYAAPGRAGAANFAAFEELQWSWLS